MIKVMRLNNKAAKFWLKKILWRHLVGLAVGAFSLFPLVWMISAAFDVTGQISTQQLIPLHRGLDNFQQLFSSTGKPYLTWGRNSLVVAFSAAAMQIVQMFPQLLAATTLFLIINTFGKSFAFLGLGHQLPLILIFGGAALGVNTWMLKSFFDTLPTEIDEAAKIDGAGHFEIFLKIIIPLATPVFVVTFLLSLIGILNEYLITSVILGLDSKNMTVAVGLQQFIYGQYGKNWGPFTAGALIATIPVMALFIFLQKHLVSGLVSGSTKG